MTMIIQGSRRNKQRRNETTTFKCETKSWEYFKFVFQAELNARYVKITTIQIALKIKT
jgi:hypothetical protein